jgi:hypothetical protein
MAYKMHPGVFLVEGAYTQQGRAQVFFFAFCFSGEAHAQQGHAHSRRLHPSEAARSALRVIFYL